LAGMPSVFLRLAGCNLRCSFCDTEEALQGGSRISVLELGRRILEAQGRRRNLVITGGEPLLQAQGLELLLSEVIHRFLWVEVETNGTLPPLGIPGLRYNVSPKLSNSGETYSKRIREENLRRFLGLSSIFKFVIRGREDVEEVLSLVEKVGIPGERVYLMPMAASLEDLKTRAPEVALLAVEHGFRYSDRFHLRLSMP